jgi:uncharacterized protein YbjT (DUF2867 family)
MRVLIAGANGKIGHHLVRQMAASEHRALAMVRDSAQTPTMQRLGAWETVLGNLEEDCTGAMRDCDAVIFTAGSGPHTGPEKTVDVDQDGAIRLIDCAKVAGVRRFIMVSSMRAEDPEQGPEKIRHYLRAKRNADEHLRNSGLTYTIVRPGPLSEEAGSGKVEVAERLDRSGKIPREDVATVLVTVLDAGNTENRTFDVLSGETPVSEAIDKL